VHLDGRLHFARQARTSPKKALKKATDQKVLAFLRAKIMKAQSAPLQKARIFYISQKKKFVKVEKN